MAGGWSRCAAAIAFAVTSTAATARAAPDADAGPSDPQARAKLAAGMEKFDDGDFAGAQVDFAASFVKESNPLSLWGWAQATNKVDGCRKSVPLYRRFSKMVDPSSAAYDVALQAIAECADELARDEPEPEPEPEPDLSDDPEPDLSDDPPDDGEPRERPWHRDPLGGVLVGVGAATLASGIGVLAAASVEKDDPCETYDCFEQQQSRIDRLTIAGAVVVGIGGALLVGGAIRWAVVGVRQRGRTSALPIVNPRFVGVSLRGRF